MISKALTYFFALALQSLMSNAILSDIKSRAYDFRPKFKERKLSMKQLQVFNFNSNEVRTVQKDGQPWFVLSDVCKVLEIGNPSDVKARLEDGVVSTEGILDALGRTQQATIINEDGLYDVILESRKSEAKAFRKWITGEVLPTIRKTGGYVANDELFINTYLPFADEQTKLMFTTTLSTVRKQNQLILDQQKELEYKGNVIVGLVDEIDLAEKRQTLNRIMQKKGGEFQDRWRELYRQFEMKYRFDLGYQFEKYNETHKPKMKSKVDYIEKVMGKLPQLYEIACKLFENDVKKLVSEIYQIS